MSRYLVKAVVLAVFFLRTLLSLAQSRSPSLLKSILGGISISLHLTSPLSRGLFHRAITQSNFPVLSLRRKADDIPRAKKFAEKAGCSYGNWTCLRALNTSQILEAQGESFILNFTDKGLQDMPWMPYIDGTQIIGQPLDLIRAGNFNRVPVMLGSVGNETLSFLYPTLASITSLEYDALVALYFGLQAIPVLQMYPASLGITPTHSLSILTTDMLCTCPMRAMARFLSAYVPTHLYLFLHPPAHDPINLSPECEGEAACHGAELAFVFHSESFYPNLTFSPAEDALSLSALNIWTSWTPPFPEYTQLSDAALAFVLPRPVIVQGYHLPQCTFWDSYFGFV